MNKTLKTLVVAALFVGATVTAFAQSAGPNGSQTPPANQGKAKGKQGKAGKGDPQMMLKRDAEILAKLNLTKEQEESVKKLKSETETKFKDLMKSKTKGDDKKELRDKLKEVITGYQNGLKEILTPVQMEDYAKAMKAATRKKKDGGN